MLSAILNALQVDAWHVLYIFPLCCSLNKCRLIYRPGEIHFYLCRLGAQSVLWSLGHIKKHTTNRRAEIAPVAVDALIMDTLISSHRTAAAGSADTVRSTCSYDRWNSTQKSAVWDSVHLEKHKDIFLHLKSDATHSHDSKTKNSWNRKILLFF